MFFFEYSSRCTLILIFQAIVILYFRQNESKSVPDPCICLLHGNICKWAGESVSVS